MATDPVDRFGALFKRAGEHFEPTELTRGPWNPNAMHGGAPSALLAYVLARHDPGPASFVARLTVELLRPVPLVPLRVAARTFRPGKKVQWIEGSLLADGHEVARATVLRVRDDEIEVGTTVSPTVGALRPPSDAAPPAWGPGTVGFWSAHDVQIVSGGFGGVPGPASAWFRLRCPVVDDEPPAPFERVAAAADFGSGVGNPLTFETATAINPEVTIHVYRDLVGQWVGLESGGWAGGRGAGLVATRLHDEHGVVGIGVQTLLVNPVR